jgi:hypothetical protein
METVIELQSGIVAIEDLQFERAVFVLKISLATV